MVELRDVSMTSKTYIKYINPSETCYYTDNFIPIDFYSFKTHETGPICKHFNYHLKPYLGLLITSHQT